MLTILKELWPFFKEFILKNKELREDVKDPKTTLIILLSLTAIGGVIYLLYSMFIVLVSNSHNRSVMLSKDLIRVEASYRTLTEDSRVLSNKLHSLQLERNSLEIDLMVTNKLLKRHETTNLLIGGALEKCLLDKRTLTPTGSVYDYDTNTLFIKLQEVKGD